MAKLVGVVAVGISMALAVGPAQAQNYEIPKAPGQYCKGQSKKKQPGQKKTPFAQCVSAVAKAQRSLRTTPRQACRTLSKKKARGQKAKGTPFSICVKGAARAQRDIRAAS